MTDSRIRRTAIAVTAQIIAVLFGLPAFYEAQDAGILTAGFDPAWWFWPAMAAAVVASLYSMAVLRGLIHQKPRTTEEIHEEILDE